MGESYLLTALNQGKKGNKMTHAEQILAGEKRETDTGLHLVFNCKEDCGSNFSGSSCDFVSTSVLSPILIYELQFKP